MLMLKKDNLDLIASSNGIESSMETYYLNYLNVVTAHALTAISLGPKFLQALIKIFTFFYPSVSNVIETRYWSCKLSSNSSP